MLINPGVNCEAQFLNHLPQVLDLESRLLEAQRMAGLPLTPVNHGELETIDLATPAIAGTELSVCLVCFSVFAEQ